MDVEIVRFNDNLYSTSSDSLEENIRLASGAVNFPRNFLSQ
jgi:hypothetical protein